MMRNYIVMQFLIIIINILNSEEIDEEFYNMNAKCKKALKGFQGETYLGNSKKFLMEIMRGKMPFKLNETTLDTFNLDVIKRINKNIPCVYEMKYNKYSTNNNTRGLFLGAGINLFNINHEQMEEILRRSSISKKNKNKYLELIDNVHLYLYKILIFDDMSSHLFEDVDEFNKAVMDYKIQKYIEATQDKQNYKSPLINGLLSAYFQFYNGDYYLRNSLAKPVGSTSYMVENLNDLVPFARLIQSKLILMMDGTMKFNSNHIIFVVPLFLFDEKNIIQIKNLINWLYKSINYISNPNRISILAISQVNDYSKIVIFNGKNDLDNLFKIEYKNRTEYVDLDKIYEILNTYFDSNKIKDLYENKIISLFLNYDTHINQNKDVLLEKYKNNFGIQTIPIINTEICTENQKSDIFEYNIFYNFTEENIYVAPLKLAISNMHIYLDLSLEDVDEKRINDLNLNDIDAPMYIEVGIKKENNKLRYYEISFEINETSKYNIFISDSNPYPSIKDHIAKYLKYENKLNPKLIMKVINIDKFYVAIEGILHFNIIIRKKLFESEEKMNEVELSEGDYKEKAFDMGIQLKDKYLSIQIFSDNANFTDYNMYSYIYKNEIIENLMKYFLSGIIDLDNTNDNSFFNYELFIYLYGNTHLINRVYKDQNKNYYFGRYIRIDEFTPLDLKDIGFNRLIINKLYPFLLINKLLNETAPSIIFNDEELKTIYNIIFEDYLIQLKNKLANYPQCIKFDDQPPSMKFIIFCLYFSYYYDSHILKQIVNLSLKTPKFSDVLQYLSNKNLKSDLFIINYIKILEQENKNEKIMVNIVLGKSLALTEPGIHFVKEFYNTMSKSKTKISLSIYDTIDNEIETIIPFSYISNYKAEEISEFNKSYYYQMHNYNNEKKQNMNFDKIINFGLSQFSKYDNGIKKKLIILCNENINIKEKYYINNNLINIKDNKYNDLIDKEIELLILTTKSYEKGDFFSLFQNNISSYNIYDNYFHINDLNNTEEYMDDLRRKIKDSSIKIKVGKRLINDFNQGKMTYYEIINKENKRDVIVIKTDMNNFNFYSSLTHPFPNSNTGELVEKGDDAVVISYGNNNERVYVGIEPINTVKKQQIEIFTCLSYNPNSNCKYIGDYKNQWIFSFILFFGFWLFFMIYKCKRKLFTDSITQYGKILNVFDKVQ